MEKQNNGTSLLRTLNQERLDSARMSTDTKDAIAAMMANTRPEVYRLPITIDMQNLVKAVLQNS